MTALGIKAKVRFTSLVRRLMGIAIFALPLLPAGAGTFAEDFAVDPATNGWQIYGDTNLFVWDGAKQMLRVTWDSAKTNSYFHRPLGTILTGDDDFSLSFAVRLEDYAIGTTPGKPGTFEIAIGFLNLGQAIQTNFFRGAGVNATYGPRNLVEFDFFPAFDSFLPTLGQVMVSTNNAWLYDDSNLLDMTPGETFQVNLTYAAVSRALTTVISNNATQYGPTQTIIVPADFDFRLTTLAISSYSDAIQPPPAGSIRAHGTVDNITVTVPPPPVGNLAGAFVGPNWQVQFTSRTNWLYALERTTDLTTWTSAAASAPGNNGTLTLSDPNPATDHAFYRVRASRP